MSRTVGIFFLSFLLSFTIPTQAKPWKMVSNDQILLGSVTLSVSNGVILRCTSLIQSTHIGGDWCFFSTDTPQEALDKAALLHEQFDAWPDLILPQQEWFNDPLYEGQWYLPYLEAEMLFDRSLGSDTIKIAVIDSGIDISHPDLSTKVHAPLDVVNNDEDPSPDPGDYCFSASSTDICDEHGTAVSGIVSATSNNNVGMVGLCPNCTLIPIRMLGGSNLLSNDVRAFAHAIEEGADVINNSWGFTEPIPVPTPLKEIIQEAYTQGREGLGAVVVFAAGNDDREIEEGELCTLEEVLCISAIDRYGRPTSYTNYGSSIDLAAPSATVSIAPQENTTINFGGTSAAAPVVSGITAWILSEHPTMTSEEVYRLLTESASPSPLVQHDEQGHHPFYGYGVISVQNLLDSLYPPQEEPKAQGCTHAPLASFLFSPLLLVLYRRS
jgi:serine protease